MEQRSVADLEGPWSNPDFESSLIARSRQFWTTPVHELPNAAVAMFLRQNIATELMIPEARRRIEIGPEDNSELYDGELAAALESADQ